MESEDPRHCLGFAGGAVDRVAMMAFDDLLDDVLELRIAKPEYNAEMRARMVEVDKFYVYRSLWDNSIAQIFSHYLPSAEAPQPMKLEVTPFTIMLCRLVPAAFDKEGFLQRVRLSLGIDQDAFEANPEEHLRALKIDFTPLSKLPAGLRPANLWDQLALSRRLMNFPPLRAIARFYRLAHVGLADRLSDVREKLGRHRSLNLSVRLRTPLHYSEHPFSPDLLKRHPLASLASDERLSAWQSRILESANLAAKLEVTATGTSICGACGTATHAHSLSLHHRQWIVVMRDEALAEAIGFALLDEVEQSFRHHLSESLSQTFSGLNTVAQPDGLLLVEGKTETGALPVVALKLGMPLADSGIKLFDCEGKQNVSRTLKKLRREFPKLPIVSLLDEDATKEEREIERMIRGSKNRYEVFRLKSGTIEDLFPIEYSVRALNVLYPGETPITDQDFLRDRGFIENANDVLWRKRQTTFDKARFGTLVAMFLPPSEVPQELRDILERAHQLVAGARPLRLSSTRDPK